MKINFQTPTSFKRRLKTSEESEYINVLKMGKEKLGSTGKSILIVPSASLPQGFENNTGVGNIASNDGMKFIEFAQKYWGINEVQLLPNGQYHSHHGIYPIYSGTSMDLGNHLIDVKSFVPKDDYKKIVSNNKEQNRINYTNVIDINCVQENILRKLHSNMSDNMKKEFKDFKLKNNERLLPKGLYQALREIHATYNYNKWSDLDKNLFDDRVVNISDRNKRISELMQQKGETVDFYMFKQFLAEKSFQTSKNRLNSKGIKVSGDMICGFSFDEVWANPKAFIKEAEIGWGLPALNFQTLEGENLLRKKVNFYAQHYDGIRVDASWSYASQKLINCNTQTITRNHYNDKFLNIIDEEFLKVKGPNYNLHNIMHEFSADDADFSMFDGEDLKPYVKNRNKILTSDSLLPYWGSNNSCLKRGWNKECFIIGARNHDSKPFSIIQEQIKVLSDIFKIPTSKLQKKNEFIKAKLAEPYGAYNNMIFFIDALGLNGEYKQNSDKTLDYTAKIPTDYETYYFNELKKGRGFNAMDALEKNFKARGLDKTERKLYKKIVKYKKILEGNEAQTNVLFKCGIGIVCASLVIYGIYKYYTSQSSSK